jgi:hypothetical protein
LLVTAATKTDAGSSIVIIGGGAAGGVVLLLILVILIVVCIKQRKGGYQDNKDTVYDDVLGGDCKDERSLVYTNLSGSRSADSCQDDKATVYDDVVGAGVEGDKSELQSSTVIANPAYENSVICEKDTQKTIARKENPSYENLSKPTSVVQPVQRTANTKEETAKDQDVAINQKGDDDSLGVAIIVQSESDGYDAVGLGTNGSNKGINKELSNGEPSPSLLTDKVSGTFAANESKNPKYPADDDLTTIPPTETCSCGTLDVTRPIRRKTDHGQSAVPSETEYSYARPDVKRTLEVSFDRLEVGPAVTEKGEDGVFQDRIGDRKKHSYTTVEHDSLKSNDNVYARPDVKKTSPDRFAVGNDEYTVPAKRVPPNPAKKPLKDDVQSATPVGFTVNKAEYAVSSVISMDPRRENDRGFDESPDRSQSGEYQNTLSVKSESLSSGAKKVENSLISSN